MRIAVNTRLLISDKLDGIGWFTHEVLKRLVLKHPEHEFLFLFDRSFDSEFIYAPNVSARILFPQARHPLLYRMYFEYSVPKALKQWKADLFFSPDGFLSLRTRVPQIPVIHDINFEHRPEDLPKAYASYYRNYFPQFAKKAKRIITVSDYSANDISETYGIERSLIDVAPNGRNDAYRPLVDDEKVNTRNKHSMGLTYFVFIGNFSFRKNIHGIIEAYDQYRQAGGTSYLLLVGNPLWTYPEMDAALSNSNFADQIILTGHLAIEELTLVLGAAQALIFPSYFEGFGIPIVEAFAAGTPVICSDQTSLPEVAGDAALYSTPENHALIAEHMMTIEKNNSIRESLTRQGLERVMDYSWDRTANKIDQALFQ